MKCLIVAAGQGTRLREKGGLKPLIPLRGTPLIEHVIARARQAGVSEFVVVSGYRGDELRRALDAVADRHAVDIVHAVNDDWRRANGVSVLVAKPLLSEPFLLSMCDHVVDPDILRMLMAEPVEPGTVTLAVDFKIDDPLNDPDDVTRVRCSSGRIEAIGKSLVAFNALDTGVFLCTTAMFEALAESQAGGDDSISGAMNVLSRRGKALVRDVGTRLWVDVDDPVGFGKADKLIEQEARGVAP